MVTKIDLLREVTDIEIYRCYAPDLDIAIGKPMLSPLREEDDASFGLFIGENNEVCFNDFVLGGGDCIKFVQLMFGDTFFEALSRIVIDFKLQDVFIHKTVNASNKPPANKLIKEDILRAANSSLIRKRRRAWNRADGEFWTSFGIDKATLIKYRVEPVSHIFINMRIIACDAHTYCFTETKDGIETYKIYQPFNKEYKWLNNHNDSVWQGWEQLPEKGELLIITKALKDVMTIDCITGIPAVALQAESVVPKLHIIEELKSRFTTIWLWYDNDFDKETNWGLEFGKKLSNEFDLLHTFIPSKYKAKDPSDFTRDYGKVKAKSLILDLTGVPF